MNKGGEPKVTKRPIFLLILLMLSVFLISCTKTKSNENELVFWTDMTETEALKKAITRFEQKHPFKVRMVRVPFEELQPKFQVAAPVRKGPDVITGPHDWIGPFATAELISPIDLTDSVKSDFMEVPLKTLSFKGKLYGLPISLETLGLIYNKKYIKKPPQTMEELIVISQHANNGTIDELKGKKSESGNSYDDMLNYSAINSTKVSGFLFELEDFYFSWAFLGGYGASIFKDTPQGLDPLDVELDKEPAIKGMDFLKDLKNKYNLIPQGMSKDIASGRFMEDNLLFTINGPWSLVDYKRRNISFGFAPLPILNTGKRPAPFVGVQGIYLNSRSKNKEMGLELMKEICSTQGEVDIYLEGGRCPARFDSLQNEELSGNEDLKGILQAANDGTPMPNIPEMGAIWQPMKEAVQLIMNDKLSTEQALKQASSRIKSNVERMRR